MPQQKLYGLTPAELARLQRAIRYIEDNASMYKAQRRVRGQQQGGTGIRHAYCKTAAGTGNTIVCYLDENIAVPPQNPLPAEITVNFFIFNATALSSCIPLLVAGQMIPVYKVGEYWFCPWWFSGTEEC
jgi:hypothetical protein